MEYVFIIIMGTQMLYVQDLTLAKCSDLKNGLRQKYRSVIMLCLPERDLPLIKNTVSKQRLNND